jgi:sortase A
VAAVFARVLAAIGRTMITAGVLMLLFVAYQLWGTGIRTAQAQNDLEDSFAAELEAARAAVVSTTSTSTSATTATTVDPAVTTTSRLPATTAPPLPPELLPERGEAAGRIVIDRIGVDWIFVEGVSVSDLKNGPGHYPDAPMPGQAGNAAIAGHRTTYGAPFHNVDQLQPGDEIRITTVQGDFTYLVRATEIVSPSQVEVLSSDHWDFDGDGAPEPNVLTLTACHPKYSARQRIVIGAELVGEPAPSTPRPAPVEGDDGEIAAGADDPVSFEGDLSGDRAAAGPTVAWGVVCAAIWLLAWALGKRWRRVRWPAYAVGLLPFLAALFFFFEEFSRLLPANY